MNMNPLFNTSMFAKHYAHIKVSVMTSHICSLHSVGVRTFPAM